MGSYWLFSAGIMLGMLIGGWCSHGTPPQCPRYLMWINAALFCIFIGMSLIP